MTIAEYLKEMPNAFIQGLGEAIVTEQPSLDFFELVDTRRHTGFADALRVEYRRQSTAPTVDAVDPDALVTDSAFTSTAVITKQVKEFASYDKVASAQNSLNGIALVIAEQAKAAFRKLHREIIHGDDSVDANTFDGLNVLRDATQFLSLADSGNTSGQQMTRARMQYGLDQVRNSDKSRMGLFLHERDYRKLKSLTAAAPGATPADFMVDTFGNPVFTFDGVRVYKNNWIGTANGDSDITGYYGSNKVPYGSVNNILTTVNDTGPADNAVLTVLSGAALTAGRYYVMGTTIAEAQSRQPWKAVSIATNDVTLDGTPTTGGALVTNIEDGDNIYPADIGTAYFMETTPIEEDGVFLFSNFDRMLVTGDFGWVGSGTQGSSMRRYGTILRAGLGMRGLYKLYVLEGFAPDLTAEIQ